ncbi:cobalamin B12-binding domain-containing protein, partial [Nostoc sp. HG1]|nr:cobalamin B12-binding domain-containing protein [Nostoc sp. HG1]
MTALPLRVLSVIPPMTQLNTPYPSTAYLTGFLRSRGMPAVQVDLALGLVLALFSRKGLQALHSAVQAIPNGQRGPTLQAFASQFESYAATLAPTLAFLQGRDPTLAHRIAPRGFLPEGPRFAPLDAHVAADGEPEADPLAWAFGALGQQDRARHIATLYLNDLADVVRQAVDERFEFVRYGERLAMSQASFDPLATALAAAPTFVDSLLQDLALQAVAQHQPDVLLLSVPFPGAVYGAFRIAQVVKAVHPHIRTVLGGGYVNTELRELAEPRVFDYFDALTLDAGERPLLALLEHFAGKRSTSRLVRSFVRREGQVRYIDIGEADIAFEDVGAPTWDGLPLDQYLSLLDMLNPMHRLWSDGRWNKL